MSDDTLKAKSLNSEEKPKSLVTLSSEYQRAVDEILSLEESENVDPDRAAALDRAVQLLCDKVDAYGIVEKKLENLAAFWKEQKNSCAGAQKACENARESLRARMKYVLGHHPEHSLQGEYFRFFLAKAQPSLEIDEQKLSPEWKKAVTTTVLVPDKERIKAALQAGELIPGAALRDSVSLRSGKPKP